MKTLDSVMLLEIFRRIHTSVYEWLLGNGKLLTRNPQIHCLLQWIPRHVSDFLYLNPIHRRSHIRKGN